MAAYVLHVDLDEFIAAVETLRRPELRGRPVVVGGDGDPTKRGVVATAGYVARERGVHSGMPLRVALRRCPECIFLPVDKAAYEAASSRVMAVLRGFSEEVEVWGWDEAFVQTSGDAESLAHEIRRAVRAETGLSCAVGIGDNKLLAKTATGFAKPGGIYRLSLQDWLPVMGPRNADALWGVGKKKARRLHELGIETVADLAAADPEVLATSFGPRVGPWLQSIARGESTATVSAAPRRAKSTGVEHTFEKDVTDHSVVEREVLNMTARLHARLDDDRSAVGVTVKLRLAPFFTGTRSVRVRPATRDLSVLEAAALEALGRFDIDRPIRLVGVKLDLDPAT